MLYFANYNIVYSHFPKTAGGSCKRFLVDTLEPKTNESFLAKTLKANTKIITINRPNNHLPLHVGLGQLKKRGIEPKSLDKIVTGIRHPLDMVLSLFLHWNRQHKRKVSLKNSEKFIKRKFKGFALNYARSGNWTYKKHLLVDGCVPENLYLLRFEHLTDDLVSLCESLGVKPELSILHGSGRTQHDGFIKYYDKEMVEKLESKFKWCFDQGYYSRQSL